jgi:ATP-binding cassette subfamily B multidrug efflux pump
MSDLSLPGFMSDIVNVGIQQGGIEKPVPQAIRSAEFSKVTLFMTADERAEVSADYILLDRESLPADQLTRYLKKYPELAKEPVYALNTTDKTKIAALATIFERHN